MMTTNEVAKVFDTILSIPGMNETVKINLKISRKNVLLLNAVIERGLSMKDGDEKSFHLLQSFPKDSLEELRALSADLLQKSDMTGLSEKLSLFGPEKKD